MRIFHAFALFSIIGCSSAPPPYQAWIPLASNPSLGTGYKVEHSSDGVVVLVYEHALGKNNDSLEPLLRIAAQDVCQGDYTLSKLQLLDMIITHSSDQSIQIRGELSCADKERQPKRDA